MTHLTLTTTIEPMGPAAAIVLTNEQAAQLSTAKTPPVVVRIGDRSERLRIARMGGPACIGLSKAARQALGVEIGDEVEVSITLDEEERTVEVPPLLAEALAADPDAAAAFRELSYTRRQEIAVGIAQAKREETQQKRLAKALAELGQDG